LAYRSTWCHADGINSSITTIDRGRVVDHLARRHLQRGERSSEESPGGIGVAVSRDERVDDLPVLVDGPVHVPPHAVDLDIRLIHKPPITR